MTCKCVYTIKNEWLCIKTKITIILKTSIIVIQLLAPTQPVTDCSRLHKEMPSGKYTIRLNQVQIINVYCDMDTDGGGWTVSRLTFYLLSNVTL